MLIRRKWSGGEAMRLTWCRRRSNVTLHRADLESRKQKRDRRKNGMPCGTALTVLKVVPIHEDDGQHRQGQGHLGGVLCPGNGDTFRNGDVPAQHQTRRCWKTDQLKIGSSSSSWNSLTNRYDFCLPSTLTSRMPKTFECKCFFTHEFCMDI